MVQAYDQDVRGIEANTFKNGKNIRMLELGKNKLIHLEVDSKIIFLSNRAMKFFKKQS